MPLSEDALTLLEKMLNREVADQVAAGAGDTAMPPAWTELHTLMIREQFDRPRRSLFATHEPVPLPEDPTDLDYIQFRKGYQVTDEQVETIVALKRDRGHGKRTIARMTLVPHAIVTAVLQEHFGVGPAEMPRLRPRREDWERAMAAGITPDEYTAERRAGGRAETIDTLTEWVTEVVATTS